MDKISSYGVLEQNTAQDDLDVCIEELRLSGFTTLNLGLSETELVKLSMDFDNAFKIYCTHFTQQGFDLFALNEHDVVRVMPFWAKSFLRILFHKPLHKILKRVLGEYYIVNQVNGLINPAHGKPYSQSAYHRDLPFRHMTVSRPIALNALFALDEFTFENGATFVIPGSHSMEKFPSDAAVRKLERQIVAPRGTFVILDCMTFHAGGINNTETPRRAVNHVFTIPAIRQQLHLPSIFKKSTILTESQKKIMGYGLNEFGSHNAWFQERQSRKQARLS